MSECKIVGSNQERTFENELDSVEFESLPLQEVALRLVPAAPLVLTLPKAISYVARLEPLGWTPYIGTVPTELAPGSYPEISFGTGIERLAFMHQDQGLIAIVQSNVVALRWQHVAGGTAYPRYRAMREHLDALLAGSVEAADVSSFAVAQMAYVVHPEADGSTAGFEELLNQDTFARICVSGVAPSDLNIGWRDHGIDFRVVVGAMRVGSSPSLVEGRTLTTIAGIYETDVDMETVDRLHSAFIAHFRRWISPTFQARYGLRP